VDNMVDDKVDDRVQRSGGRNILVTGAAGFIGSRMCEVLLAAGHSVRGVDCFTDYYGRAIKLRNVAEARDHNRFTFFEADLADADLAPITSGCDAVIHLAAMPGLVRSWTDVAGYSHCNVVATAKLLEAVSVHAPSARFIQVSTSSAYGQDATGDETTAPKPISPYGVTKLAAEYLVRAYETQVGLDAVILRYFSVYGPRQRPDMAYNIFCQALLDDTEIKIFGDGGAVRSNTYVDDCVHGTLQALESATAGELFNIGGGVPITVNDALTILAEVSGRTPRVVHVEPRRGDQRVTIANFDKATREIGYRPSVAPAEGLARQWDWHTSHR
jgi:nucleoside-diphosphate-sugar epimerase